LAALIPNIKLNHPILTWLELPGYDIRQPSKLSQKIFTLAFFCGINRTYRRKRIMAKFQKVVLTVTFFKEGNKFIAYTPALNLSTCGNSMEQAKRRFEEMVQLFLEETCKMGTMEDVLLECGWKKAGHPQKRWQPPIFIGQKQEEVRIPCPA
jgi:hypothetical protein